MMGGPEAVVWYDLVTLTSSNFRRHDIDTIRNVRSQSAHDSCAAAPTGNAGRAPGYALISTTAAPFSVNQRLQKSICAWV
jgi:hypothetical protein